MYSIVHVLEVLIVAFAENLFDEEGGKIVLP